MALVVQISSFEELQEIIENSGKEYDREQIEAAYRLAEEKHREQKRSSGEPYIIHPLSVAAILVGLGMDSQSVMAGLLHDVVEDTDCTLEDIQKQFGKEVALLIDGVTKLGKIPYSSREEQQAENLRKMLMAMAEDIRVIIIKFADRMHNLSTLEYMSPQKQRHKAVECLEVYAPIADRLGIRTVKEYMEDISLKYLDPQAYREIEEDLSSRSKSRKQFIEDTKALIRGRVEISIPDVYIEGRVKSIYGIYRKMFIQGKTFEEIYDVFAVRVIVDTIEDCYNVLGIIHDMFQPLPGRFKDYISMPKPNMYQSLHTTVIGREGVPFEVQIRTWAMHQTAEYGVAAHWKYKQGLANKQLGTEHDFEWVRKLLESQQDTDPDEFVRTLKVDMFADEVFVFTPNGDVKSLPAGATPIDFAYSVHSAVGNRMVGAKVNGSIVPLSYQLQVGDRVEVLTQKSASPSRDWLNIVKTPSARSKIRSYFSKITRSDDMQMGRDMLVREMRKHGLGLSSAQSMRALKLVAEALGFKDPDEMYVHIGTGKEKAQHVTNRLLKILVDKGNEEAEKPTVGTSASSTGIMAPMLTSVKRPKKHETHSSQGIVVKGVDDVLVRLSRCCNPVPGDDILGFVTRGRGVSVHRADCPNALDLKRHPERIIEVEWEGTPTAATYQVEIYIEALDRMNLLLDVTRVISEMGANVLSCNTTTHRDGMVEMRFLFQLSDLAVIERMTKRLSAIDGVFDARRMMPAGSRSSK